MESTEIIKARLVAWSPQVAAGLARSAGNDLEEIADQVQHRGAVVFSFDDYQALAVCRLDNFLNRVDFVVVCFEGEQLHKYAPFLIDQAKRAGADSLRVHTARPGLARMLSRYEFKQDEIVLRRAI